MHENNNRNKANITQTRLNNYEGRIEKWTNNSDKTSNATTTSKTKNKQTRVQTNKQAKATDKQTHLNK